MRRVELLLGVSLSAALTVIGCDAAKSETNCDARQNCGGTAGSGGATAGSSGATTGGASTGGASTGGTSTGGTTTGGTGGVCDTAPAMIPLGDLSESPPVTTPDWMGELTWNEPSPAPEGGYEVEVYTAGCAFAILPGFPQKVATTSFAWTPPATGDYRWRVRPVGGPGCPEAEWSAFRVLLVPGASIPVCSATSPDLGFGTGGGKATFYLPGCTYDSVATDIALDPTSTKGEFYTTGRYYNGTTRRGFVMKHDAQGALVPGFGNNGVVDLGTPSEPNYVHTVIVDCDGAIHIGSRTDWNMRILRLNKDGTVDSTFGGGTGQITDMDTLVASVTESGLMDLDPKGRYVQSSTKWTGPDGVAVLSRFKASGELDPSFGDSGRAYLDLDSAAQDAGGPVKVQPDGKVVMAGYTAADYPYVTTTQASDLAVARVTTNGVLDAGFGTGGMVRIDISGTAELPTNLAIQPDGRILVIGITNHSTSYLTPSQWVVARLTEDGALDPSFGQGGIAIFDPPFGGPNDGNDRPLDVIVRPDSTIWVAGQWGWNSGAGRAVLARLTPDGKLDTCFGTGGWYSVSSWPQGFSQSDSFNGMTQQPDGSLLLAAGVNPSAFGYAGIMRFKD